MKKLYFLLLAFIGIGISLNGQKYLQPMFGEIEVTRDLMYGANISVITGAPALDTLIFDVYAPKDDTTSDRPVIIYFATGSFLPIGLNGTTTGSIRDYTVQRFANIAASYGYVVFVPEYRLGWNPLDSTAALRAKGLLEAAYRGIQDGRGFIRYLNMTVEDQGNPFQINPKKIAAFGQGTGGYLSMAIGSLDKVEKIALPKWRDPLTGDMLIDTALLGDLYGVVAAPLNIPNHVGYSDDIHFAYNIGGALGDTAWADENTVPIASAHIVLDPFAPFGINFQNGEILYNGPVIVPTTGEFVTTVAGSRAVMEYAEHLGINEILNESALIQNDPLTALLESQPFATKNLYAIGTGGNIYSGVWEYWDPAFWGTQPHPACGAIQPPTCSFHTVGLQLNPNMSMDQANAYIDTIFGHFIIRSYVALQLEPTSTEDISPIEVGLKMFPNPAKNMVTLTSDAENPIHGITLYDLNGRQVLSANDLNTNHYQIDRGNLGSGMFIVELQFEKGIVHQRLMFE